MANQILARLGIVMAVDSAELEVGLSKAKEQFKGFTKEVQRQSNEAAKETMALKMATETYGKTLTAVQRLELEMKYGKYAGNMLTEQQNKLLREQAAAYDAVKAAADKANAAKVAKGGLTPQMSAALGYQTTDIITGLAGGQNPFMVLLQQGGQLRDQFGGFKPMFQGIAQAITMTRVAVTGFIGVIGAFGYAVYQGREEQKAFNAALATTNNYAGITYSNFGKLADTLSDRYHISLRGVRGALQDLVASGQFTSASLVNVADTIAKIAKVSNQSADEVAKNLMPSLDGSASSAKRLNDQYHFLTDAQYRHIAQLNAQGEKQKAVKYTMDLLNGSITDQNKELKGLPKLWDDLTASLGKYWQRTKDLAGEETPEIAAQRLRNRIAYLQTGDMSYAPNKEALAGAQEQLRLLQKQVDAEEAIKKKRDDENAAREKKLADEVEGRNAARRRIKQQAEDADIAARTMNTADGLDKIANIELQRIRDIDKLKREQQRLNEDENFAYVLDRRTLLAKKEIEINTKAAKDKEAVYAQAREQYRLSTEAEQKTLDQKAEELKFDREHLLYTGADLDIALSRLKTEQEIAAMYAKKDSGSETDKAKRADDLRQLQKQREEIIGQQYELQRLKDMNAAVFANMGSAIDTFVRTGKFAFKDFARSVIQDLIAIAMKAQMMSMFKGFSFFNTGGGPTGQFESDINTSGFALTASAVGGPLAAGQPSIVGENGPELFVPRGAGTIIPNSGDLSGAMGGQTVNYNGPFIQNMSAIDTQSAQAFLLKNKTTVWAANQSASRAVPASR